MSHDWPGNARELNNIVQRAAWLAAGGSIDAADLDTGAAAAPVEGNPSIAAIASVGANASVAGIASTAGNTAAQPAALDSGLDRDLKDRERELILATLRVTGGNRKLTAERLGISPRTLRHKLQQFKAAGVNVPRIHDQFMTV
jgi:two-component system response regulator FlrC